jgi:hypothetical protein
MCCTFVAKRKADGELVTLLLEDEGRVRVGRTWFLRSRIRLAPNHYALSDVPLLPRKNAVRRRLEADDALLQHFGFEQIWDHQTTQVPCPVEV